MWNAPSSVDYTRAVDGTTTETLDVALATPDLSATGDCSSTPCDVTFTISVKGSTPSFITMQDSNKKMQLAVLTHSDVGTHKLKIKYDSVGSGSKPSDYTAARFTITCTVTSITAVPNSPTIYQTWDSSNQYPRYSSFDTTITNKY